MMDCEQVQDWIWESVARTEPPPAVMAHLRDCADCSEELRARGATGRDLRSLRADLEADPSPALDARVISAAGASVRAESGAYPISTTALDPEEIPDEIADALADSIAEDFGEQFAALTTGRLRVEREMERARAMGLLETTDPVAPPAPPTVAASSAWQPPRATPQWMAAAALLLGAALMIGFAAGRASSPETGPGLTLTTATASDGVITTSRQRPHNVKLSPGGVDQLQQGNTYLLAGPVGGPYQVLGIVGWEDFDSLPLPTRSGSEIVIAVGPAGGFSKGIELAANDLTARDVEILGRRALPTRGR